MATIADLSNLARPIPFVLAAMAAHFLWLERTNVAVSSAHDWPELQDSDYSIESSRMAGTADLSDRVRPIPLQAMMVEAVQA